ncbi:MAG: ABC transporter substrate-binding protein [Lachnospiraceae bacterium]|nr:ABC transporter substrate-binding protein [Lachnospiraceae bacterium]
MVLKKAISILLTAALAAGMCGCAGSKKSGVSENFTVGIPQDLDSLDPHMATAAGTKEVLFNMYEGLLKPDSEGNLVPAVAQEMTEKEGGRVYEFVLRPGVKFHNDAEVTVSDVKFSLDRCAAPNADGQPLVPEFSNIASVETDEAQSKVTVTLKQADTDFPAYMTCAILQEATADQEDAVPMGTGPYMFESYTPQDKLVLKRYDGYWGEKPEIKNVTFKIVSGTDTVVTDLEGGAVDMYARVLSDQADTLSANPDFQVLEGTMNLVQALYLNNDKKPFDDEKVRQALCYAVDRQEILDYVSDGKGTIIGSSMFPSFSKYYMPELSDAYKTDTEKSKSLLKEAGYPDGFSFTITVPSNYTQHVDTAVVISKQLEKVGIDAKIKEVEWGTWLTDVYTARNYEATVIGVDASNLTASSLLSRFRSDAGNNFVNFSDADYDAAYDKAMSETDDETRTQYFKECEKILSDKAANVYIQDMPEFVVIRKGYSGYKFYPLYVQDIAAIKPDR